MLRVKSRKSLKAKADRLWSAYVRNRDKTCRCCGKTPIQSHHIISRRYHSTRFNPNNGIGLCFNHHRNLAHQNPVEFHNVLVKLFGQKYLDDLNVLSQRIEKLDYVKVCSDLETKGVD